MKKIIVIPADEKQELLISKQSKEPKLGQLQEIVGGLIETVPHFTRYDGKHCVVYCNEEGKLNGLPLNRRATYLWWEILGQIVDDVLVGNVVIIASEPKKRTDVSEAA